MLQIGVDDGDVGRARGLDAFDHRGRQAAPADAVDAAHARIAPGERLHRLGGAVGRIVIDIDDFPGDAREATAEALDHRLDVLALVEARHDDGKLDRGGRLTSRRQGQDFLPIRRSRLTMARTWRPFMTSLSP